MKITVTNKEEASYETLGAIPRNRGRIDSDVYNRMYGGVVTVIKLEKTIFDCTSCGEKAGCYLVSIGRSPSRTTAVSLCEHCRNELAFDIQRIPTKEKLEKMDSEK